MRNPIRALHGRCPRTSTVTEPGGVPPLIIHFFSGLIVSSLFFQLRVQTAAFRVTRCVSGFASFRLVSRRSVPALISPFLHRSRVGKRLVAADSFRIWFGSSRFVSTRCSPSVSLAPWPPSPLCVLCPFARPVVVVVLLLLPSSPLLPCLPVFVRKQECVLKKDHVLASGVCLCV